MHQPDTIETGASAPDTPRATVFSQAQPQAEGWNVFDCGRRADGSPRIELQRIDDPEQGEPKFAADDEAWQHVLNIAQAGSALHLEALRMIDPIERNIIETVIGWWPEPRRHAS